MPSIGPELPPQLSSRKRPPENSCTEGSPPHKRQVDSTSRTIGPCVSMQKQSMSEFPDDIQGASSESLKNSLVQATLPSKSGENNYTILPSPSTTGPGIQNHFKPHLDVDYSNNSSTAIGKKPLDLSKPNNTTTTTKRILGPALPSVLQGEPDFFSADSGSSLNVENSSESDDDYGPSLPPSQSLTAQSSLNAEEMKEQRYHISDKSSLPSKPKRADWMLVPPTSADWVSRIDPTKLKNRKFTSGRGAKAPAERTGISAIWTETPEQKRQRLEDEVLGRTDTVSFSSSLKVATHHSEIAQHTQVEEKRVATREQISEFNLKNRSKSLFEEYRAAQDRGELKKLKEDDPSRRAFDREKDMSLGAGHLSSASRKQFLMRATEFGNRFQQGEYL